MVVIGGVDGVYSAQLREYHDVPSHERQQADYVAELERLVRELSARVMGHGSWVIGEDGSPIPPTPSTQHPAPSSDIEVRGTVVRIQGLAHRLSPSCLELFTLLLEQRGHFISWEAIGAALWPAASERDRARANGRACVVRLRRQLGTDRDLIVSRSGAGVMVRTQRTP